jgi:hypothetical protein
VVTRQQEAPLLWPWGVASGRGCAIGGQPGSQVGRTLEIQQGVGQGCQLLQRQGLDLGDGGF